MPRQSQATIAEILAEKDPSGGRYPQGLAGLCFVPNETLVAGDVMLAQKIALETDEWGA